MYLFDWVLIVPLLSRILQVFFYFIIMENQIEIWKDVEGYEGLYQVSSFGRVKSFKGSVERILCGSVNKGGYSILSLYSKDKIKIKYRHKLVADAFFGKSNLQVNHKDGNRLNNNIENLEYVTVRDNNIHRYKAEKTSSKYTGVSWNKEFSKWVAKFTLNSKRIFLGYFDNELDAYNAYLKALKENGIKSKYA